MHSMHRGALGKKRVNWWSPNTYHLPHKKTIRRKRTWSRGGLFCFPSFIVGAEREAEPCEKNLAEKHLQSIFYAWLVKITRRSFSSIYFPGNLVVLCTVTCVGGFFLNRRRNSGGGGGKERKERSGRRRRRRLWAFPPSFFLLSLLLKTW